MTTTTPPTADPAALLAARAAVQRLSVQEKAMLLTELVYEIAQMVTPTPAVVEHPQSSTAPSADSADVLNELDQLIREAAAAGPALADSADALAEIRR